MQQCRQGKGRQRLRIGSCRVPCSWTHEGAFRTGTFSLDIRTVRRAFRKNDMATLTMNATRTATATIFER